MMEESSHSSDESGEMISKEEAEVAELEQKTSGDLNCCQILISQSPCS